MSVVQSSPIFEAAGALATVLGLLALLAVGLRLWRRRQGTLSNPRLAVSETLVLDGRNRLVRVRDGEREHLLLLGAAGALALPSQPERSSPSDGESS